MVITAVQLSVNELSWLRGIVVLNFSTCENRERARSCIEGNTTAIVVNL